MPNLAKRNDFLDKVTATFHKELKYYTHPDVQTTAHEVGKLEAPSWTGLLIAKKTIDKTKGIEKYIELERTLTSLYCFDLTLDDVYDDFTEAQSPNNKLSKERFNELRQLAATAADEELREVLTRLIIYSDLGKSPTTRQLAKSARIDDPRLDTDDLMWEILKLSDARIEIILPSYTSLTSAAKSLLKKAYPLMRTCFGHLYFLEAGEKTLLTLAQSLLDIKLDQREKILNLVFIAQFYDAVGAQGQLNMSGSVTCTNNFFDGYMLVRDTFRSLENALRSKNINEAVSKTFKTYLLERADWIKLEERSFDHVDQFHVVLRLACTLRIFDPAIARRLSEKYKALPHAHQQLLTEQLSFNNEKGINTFARSPHYVASSAQNISRQHFEKGENDLAIQKAWGAEVCFAMLVREILTHHAEKANDPHSLSFGQLAALGNHKPEEFDVTLAVWALPRPRPTTKIKNLIFDLGHVFIKIDLSRKPVYETFSRFAAMHGIELSKEQVEERFSDPGIKKLVARYHLGEATTKEFKTGIKASLGFETIEDDDFYVAWCASILGEEEVVKQRLDELKSFVEDGYNIYLLSNNNALHRLHTRLNYEGEQWGKYFLRQYYSNTIKLCKPDIEAYKKILADNRLKADETMFFDDVLSYVEAAWKAGIRGRQFTVDYGMSNIKVMIESIDKAEIWAQEDSNRTLDRSSTLLFFAAKKFLLAHEKRQNIRSFIPSEDHSDDDSLHALEQGESPASMTRRR